MIRDFCVSACVTLLATCGSGLAGENSDSSFLYENGLFLYEICTPKTSADDPSNLELIMASECVGFLVATHTALDTVHKYYTTLPTYERRKEAESSDRWNKTEAALTPDVCFPDSVRPNILAKAVVKYGNDHPDLLTKVDAFNFASSAFLDAFPCR